MPPSPATSNAQPASVGYTLGAIMLAVTMVALSGAYGVVSWLRSNEASAARASDGAVVTRTLVGRQLSIPGNWVKGDTRGGEGFASEVSLRLSLPLGPVKALKPIEVTLLPLSQVRTSASLLDGVYLHQFLPNELAGPAGLVGKPLYGTEGYADETVWYDALSQNPFVAKCMAAPDGVGPAQCLRTVALPGGIAAVYAFDAEALAGWKDFDAQLTAVLQRIGAF